MPEKKLLIRMPEDDYEALKAESLTSGVSMNQLAITGIRQITGQDHHTAVREIVDEARTRYADVLEHLKDR